MTWWQEFDHRLGFGINVAVCLFGAYIVGFFILWLVASVQESSYRSPYEAMQDCLKDGMQMEYCVDEYNRSTAIQNGELEY